MHACSQSNGAIGADEAAMAAAQPGSTGAKPYLAPVVARLDLEETAAGAGAMMDGIACVSPPPPS